MRKGLKNIKGRILNWLHNVAEMLMLHCPDWVTGKSEVMQQKYYMRYGARDYRHLIQQNKLRTMAIYIGIAAAFLMMTTGIFIGQLSRNDEIKSIQRPEHGSSAESYPVEVQIKYKEYELKKDITIKVKKKKLTEEEKLLRLQDFETRLSTMILGENKDLNHISKPLNLMDRDPDSGITIRWTSNHPEVISEKGNVYLIPAVSMQKIELRADLTLDDVGFTKVFQLRIDPKAAVEDYKLSLKSRLNDRLEKLSEAGSSSELVLPEELGDGIEVKWFKRKENETAFLLSAFLLSILAVFFKRYDQINKKIKEAEDSMIKDLPEFINKLVLLLNAGLVVSTAFSKIINDYERFYKEEKGSKQGRKRFLYEELSEIQKRVTQSNSSLIRELKDFSQRCGVREMIRLTAIIADNWNKGSTLAEKLEGESELLWVCRKKRAEEKGKLAETKLTFPLMILLLVLIMVTVAPAMMEM